MTKVKLNGWQRLFVFFITMYFIIICIPIFFTVVIAQEEILRIKKNWAWETNKIMISISEAPYEHINIEQLKMMTKEQLLELKQYKIQEKSIFYADNKELDEIITHNSNQILNHKQYSSKAKEIQFDKETKIKQIHSDKNWAQLSILLFWLISSVIIYAIGWSIGWIYRGFQSKD